MLRASKFRIYPTPEQEKFLWAQWGAVRLVWNKALFIKKHLWTFHGKSLSPMHDLKPLLHNAKGSRKYSWLNAYDSMALQESIRHLDSAFTRFFRKQAGFPKFKSRRGSQSSYHCSCVSVGDNWVKIPKMRPIKAVVHREVQGIVKSITLSADGTGAYYAAVLWEDGQTLPDTIHDLNEDQVLGIDLGLTDLIVDSRGRRIENPKPYRKALKNLKRKQKKLSRTHKGSARREKARQRLARAHARVRRIREDYLHKVSRRLVDENQALIAESLQIKNMQKNHYLAEGIADAGWGELLRLLAYKAKRQGKHFVQVDRFFASSKTCSGCGYRLENLDLGTRKWICPQCGREHDRDINAAKNIRHEGILMLRAAGQSVLRARRVTSSSCVETLGETV